MIHHRLRTSCLRALDDRFVDIALVELGIADQRDEAAAVLPRRSQPCAVR